MKQTELSVGIKQVVTAAHFCLIMVVSAVSVSWGLQEETEGTSNCTFTKYLQSPDNRARYENTFEKARATFAEDKPYENAAMYGVIAKAGFGIENGENLDSFSAGCLSCHDGVTASNVRPNFRNNPGKTGVMSIISGKHPIGMDYLKYASANDNLKSLDEMSQHLTLVEGRVSCITCHDPLNTKKYSLRVVSSEADLCSACHRI